jgi:hypothetical protein
MRASIERSLHYVLALTISLGAFPFRHSARLEAQDKDAEYVAEMQKAEAAMSRQQFDEALKSFKRASSLRNKTSPEAHLGAARAHHSMAPSTRPRTAARRL